MISALWKKNTHMYRKKIKKYNKMLTVVLDNRIIHNILIFAVISKYKKFIVFYKKKKVIYFSKIKNKNF